MSAQSNSIAIINANANAVGSNNINANAYVVKGTNMYASVINKSYMHRQNSDYHFKNVVCNETIINNVNTNVNN